jgi:hypothetical protein
MLTTRGSRRSIKVAVMEEVLSLMESTEQWLEGIKKGLLSVHEKEADNRSTAKEDVVTLPPVLLRSVPTELQPQRSAATKAP